MRPATLNNERGESAGIPQPGAGGRRPTQVGLPLNLKRGGGGNRHSTWSGPPLNLDRHSTWSGGEAAGDPQLGAVGGGRQPALNLEQGGGGDRHSTWSVGEKAQSTWTATQLGADRHSTWTATQLVAGGGGRRPSTWSGGGVGRRPSTCSRGEEAHSTWTATQLGPPLNLDCHSTCSGGRRRPSTWSGGKAARNPQLRAGGRRPASLNLERGGPTQLGPPLNLKRGGGGATATQLEAGCHSTWNATQLGAGVGDRRPSTWSGGEGATATQLGAWGRQLASLNLERGESSGVPQLGARGEEAGVPQLGAGGGSRTASLNLDQGRGGPLNLDRHSTWIATQLVAGGGGDPQLGAGGRRPATLNFERGGGGRRPSTWSGGGGPTQLGPPLNLKRGEGATATQLGAGCHSTWNATQLGAGGGDRPPSTWSGGEGTTATQLGAWGRQLASLNLERGESTGVAQLGAGGMRPATLNLEWGGGGPLNLDRHST
ncbi:unnamed protein product [Leuciscus chuanchicus]